MAANTGRNRQPAGEREALYGFHPVMEAMVAHRRKIHSVMVDKAAHGERIGRIAKAAQERNIPLRAVGAEQIRSVSGSDQHQGVTASVSPFPVETWPTHFFREQGDASEPLMVLLDGIVDPNNLGAIVRSAHCVGVDALLIPKDRAVGPTPAVSKASAGALEYTRIFRVTNLNTTIQGLKKNGVWVAGLTMDAQQTVFQADFNGPLALVIGGEEKGIRPLVRQNCDFLVRIPLCGRIDSLNASAAAAVVLYEAFRQRQITV